MNEELTPSHQTLHGTTRKKEKKEKILYRKNEFVSTMFLCCGRVSGDGFLFSHGSKRTGVG